MPSQYTLPQLIQQEIFQKYHLKLEGAKSNDFFGRFYNPRESSGALAATRRAALVVVLFNMLKEINPEAVASISEQDILYTQITALFARSVFINNGRDEDLALIKKNCQSFLEAMGLDQSKAYFYSNLLSSTPQEQDAKAKWLDLIIQSADTIARVREKKYIFECQKIPLMETFKEANKEDMLFELAKNVLDLIVKQYDLPQDCSIFKNYIGDGNDYKGETRGHHAHKKEYERAPFVYLKVIEDFKGFPVLSEYYHDDALLVSQPTLEFGATSSALHRESIRDKAPKTQIKDDFIIKTLRGDKDNYFLQFIEGILPPNTHPKLRMKPKGHYTVDGTGIHVRSEKKSAYTQEQKSAYSKKQSVSYGMPDLHPIPFHFADGVAKTVGILLLDVKNNALLSDLLSTHDFGSVGRPNDSNYLIRARHYFENNAGDSLFSLEQLEDFKKALRKNHSTAYHNEVLARLRFTPDEKCQLFINVDELETRLLAQSYALILSRRFNLPQYQTPICYYMADSPLHLKQYGAEEQKMDQDEARAIPGNADLLFQKVLQKNFEFLLFLAPEQLMTLLKTQVDERSILIHILQSGHFHLLDFFVALNLIEIASLEALWAQEIAAIENPDLLMEIAHSALNKNNKAVFHAALSALSKRDDYSSRLNNADKLACTLVQRSLLERKPEYFTILAQEQGIDLKQTNKVGQNLLHYATANGLIEQVSYLLDQGLDINQSGNEDQHSTPLFFAAGNGHLEVVRLLLGRSDLKIGDTKKLLSTAVEGNQLEVLKLLYRDGRFDFSQNNEEGDTLLFSAKNDPATLQFLLTLPEIDYKKPASKNWGHGDTILHVAARKGYAGIVEQLLQKGMPVNDKNIYGNTALHVVVGGSPHWKSKEYKRPQNRIRIIHSLIQAGINKNDNNEYSENALSIAIKSPNTELVKALVDRGCSKNFSLVYGRSLGEWASHRAYRFFQPVSDSHQLLSDNEEEQRMLEQERIEVTS